MSLPNFEEGELSPEETPELYRVWSMRQSHAELKESKRKP